MGPQLILREKPIVTDIDTHSSPIPEKTDPEFWADMQKFIGPNAPLFIEIWRETPEGKLPAFKYFSIMAFWLGPFWFLYRKLYLWAAGVTALMMSVTVIFAEIWEIALIATGVGIGFVANKIYVNWAVQRVKSIRAAIPDLSQRQAELKRQGGVSSKNVWVVIAAIILLLFGLFFVIVIVFPPRWN